MTNLKKQIPLMAHLVLGYPTLPESLETAGAYIAAGVQILELQIPFSHPTADGPVITAACQEAALRQQVTVADCLEAIGRLRERFPRQEIIVMSYLNRVFAYGPERFAEALDRLGIRRLIVPDLPVDSALALRLQGRSGRLRLVPVLAANVRDERLEQLLRGSFDFFYLMADFKITGSSFSLHPRLKKIIAHIRATCPDARIGIGFGISTPEQALLAAGEADLVIVGSALILAKEEGRLNEFVSNLRAGFEARELVAAG